MLRIGRVKLKKLVTISMLTKPISNLSLVILIKVSKNLTDVLEFPFSGLFFGEVRKSFSMKLFDVSLC